MLSALKELHSIHYVHRDVRPENFRVHEDCVKLINFGVSAEYMKHGNHIAQARFGF